MTLEQDVTSHKDVAIEYKYYQCFQCGREQYLETDTKAIALELLKSNITYTHKEIATALDLPSAEWLGLHPTRPENPVW